MSQTRPQGLTWQLGRVCPQALRHLLQGAGELLCHHCQRLQPLLQCDTADFMRQSPPFMSSLEYSTCCEHVIHIDSSGGPMGLAKSCVAHDNNSAEGTRVLRCRHQWCQAALLACQRCCSCRPAGMSDTFTKPANGCRPSSPCCWCPWITSTAPVCSLPAGSADFAPLHRCSWQSMVPMQC